MSNCQHDHDHQQEHKHDHKHDHAHEHAHEHAHATATSSAQADPAAWQAAAGAQEAVFFIQQMDCPTEEKLIRERLGGVAGIAALRFNLIQRELSVRHSLDSVQPLMAMLQALDMKPLVKADSLDAAAGSTEIGADAYRIPRRKWLLTGAAALAALASEVVAWRIGDDGTPLVIALALLAIFGGGLGTLKKGWIALRHFSLNMNFLMSLAVIGAAILGQWPEAAVVIVLFTLAEMIEALSLERARNAIQGLMALTPDMATVQDGNGAWQEMPAKQAVLQALVRVKPGERIALDGVIENGRSAIDQAPITGESMPVEKQPGDRLFAGTINGHGALEYRVTALQGDSTLARIVDSVQQAQGQRAPTQRFVDEFARYYIPAVVVGAILVACIAPLAFGAAWTPWVYKALVLLVIACPCALVISTPVTVVSGLAAAAKAGILIKGGKYLELGRKLKAIALDKTGTLTQGKPQVTDVIAVEDGNDADAAALLALAAALAGRSDHPVSAAVATHWRAQKAEGATSAEVADFSASAGRGVEGTIAGAHYLLGNHRMVHEAGLCSPALEARLQALEQQGKSVVVLCRDAQPVLILAVADTVRPDSAKAVAQLLRMGVQPVMLTGDNNYTAQAVASQVGITDVRGDQLPQDKLAAIAELGKRYGVVGMVGDGINDAPALAQAQIGFAMGAAGTDTALETADVALMDDDLRKIGQFIRLSARTHRVLLQNITLALGIKAVFLVLALTGEATLWMAVFADMGASLLVVFNGMRLLRALPALK